MAEKDKCYLEWSTIEDLVDDLCYKIKKYQKENNFKFKDLFGLQRGGLIPAVIVSHQLGIPMTKGTISPDTLIIDDICDSGVTLADYFEKHQDEFAFPFDLIVDSELLDISPIQYLWSGVTNVCPCQLFVLIFTKSRIPFFILFNTLTDFPSLLITISPISISLIFL